MKRGFLIRLLYIGVLLLGAGAFYWHTELRQFVFPEFSQMTKGSGSMLFVGDVMLSRNVESLMRERGFEYPFQSIQTTLDQYDILIGNLEGAAPSTHVPTPPFTMQFSIDTVFFPTLRRVGFDIMTLANNHAFDYGEDGYAHMRTSLRNAGLNVAGHPHYEAVEESLLIPVGTAKVALLPLHAVGRSIDTDAVADTLRELRTVSDLQFIAIHWGEEYERTGNESQRQLAHALIDAGADAIIGHHPHVVQHIEMYNDVPIFYSLGNFVFDQYFSTDVEQGLGLGVMVAENRVTYELIPLQSTKSMPRTMVGTEKATFLNTLAEMSDRSVAPDIRLGSLVLSRPLATSDGTAMIEGY